MSNIDRTGQVVTAADVQDTSDFKEYGLVIRNGEPVAVPVDKLPKNHWTSKTRTRAKFSESQVDSLGVEKFTSDPKTKTKAKRKAPAKKEKTMTDSTVVVKTTKSKTPKLVPEWPEIREAIRDGRKLKEIAAQYGVRYYDVYRVKVHAMEL